MLRPLAIGVDYGVVHPAGEHYLLVFEPEPARKHLYSEAEQCSQTVGWDSGPAYTLMEFWKTWGSFFPSVHHEHSYDLLARF